MDFFSDYPKMNGAQYIVGGAVQKAEELFGFGYTILKWVWLILLALTLISFVVSAVRLAILADDVPYKKSVAHHDFAMSLIMLGILGSTPFIFVLIINILNFAF